MPRSSGTFTAPSSSVNPAVEGTTIDETDFNALIDDVESALTESVYTGGLGSTDNQLIRTDGTDTKKVQGTGITVDDSNNVSGIAALTATTINVGNADTTIARTGAGDISVEGKAIYRAGGTDVPIADGGTGASTATAAFNALSPTTTQGDIIYHNGTNNVRLGAGTAGQVLQTGGAGANPSWTNAGAGDVAGQSSSVDNEIALFSGTGGKTIKRATTTGILKATSGVIAAASQGTDYYAPSGTDVAIADGGTGASTAAAGARALLEGLGSTQGDILYRNGTQWTALGTGTVGQVLQAGGAGANPSWATVAGTGDVTAASSFGTDNRLIRSDGTGKGVQASGITVDDSDNVTGAANLVTASSFGTDNRLIRSDGTGKGVQSSGITIDDSDNVTGAANLVTLTGSQTLTNKVLTAPSITAPTGIDSVNGGQLAGFRNALINGGFRFWQRGTSYSSTTTSRVYTADRFAVTSAGASLTSVARSTSVRTGARTKYCCEITGNTSVTTVDYDQRIESFDVPKTTVCFTAYVYNNTGGSFTPTLYVSTPSASDDWTTSTVRNNSGLGDALQACADAAWTKVTWTADVSAYTNIDNGLEFKVRVPSGSLNANTKKVRYAEWQVEQGATATPFEQRPSTTELTLCHRFYCKSFDIDTTPANATASSQDNTAALCYSTNSVSTNMIPFPVYMRSRPSIALYSSDVGTPSNGQWSVLIGSWVAGSGWGATSFQSHFNAGGTNTGAVNTAAYIASGHWTASAEL